MLTALGFAYFDPGEYARARPALDSAPAIKRRLHPGDDVYVGQSLLGLGRLLGEQGDLPNAERLLREQVAIDRRLPADGPVDLVKGLTALGRVLHARGDVPGAERAYREAVARAPALREPSVWWGRALGGIGAVLSDEGRAADAEAALDRGAAMVRQAGGPDHPERFALLGTLAAVRRTALRRSAEAGPHVADARRARSRRRRWREGPRVSDVLDAAAARATSDRSLRQGVINDGLLRGRVTNGR